MQLDPIAVLVFLMSGVLVNLLTQPVARLLGKARERWTQRNESAGRRADERARRIAADPVLFGHLMLRAILSGVFAVLVAVIGLALFAYVAVIPITETVKIPLLAAIAGGTTGVAVGGCGYVAEALGDCRRALAMSGSGPDDAETVAE